MKCGRDYIQFHTLLEALRKDRGITLEQLCEGLCSVSQMYYIQSGKRLPDYLTRNRIIGRLGISSEVYEDYVQFDEYDRWCKRQELLIFLEESKWNEVSELLYELNCKWKKVNPIEKQFLLDIKARLKIQRCESDEEIFGVYNEIVGITMPNINYGNRNTYLSQVEFYYLINKLYYESKLADLNKEEIVKKFQKVLDWIESSPLEGISKAKILPFAVVKYYSIVKDYQYSVEKLWRYTEVAIKVLKETERSYYLEELVWVREQLISKHDIEYKNTLEKKVVSIIESLEIKYKVHTPMWQRGFIYRDSQVRSVSMVIHDRRRMLGISREELADGICSLRTLERIEANHSKPQPCVMNALFEKLNLIGDYRRTEIITDDIELIKEFDEYRKAVNQKKYDIISCKIKYIESRLDKAYIPNKQAIIKMKNICSRLSNGISNEQYVNNLEVALRLSIKKDISNRDYYYLTNGEMVLLYNIAARKGVFGWEKDVLDKMSLSSKDCRFLSNFSVFELIKDWEASRLGDDGEYEKSNNISEVILITSLKLCRIHGLYRALSNIAWNDYKSCKINDTREVYNKRVEDCIVLCDFSSNLLAAEVYRKELK